MENIFLCLLGMIFLVVLAIPIVFALTVATLLASLFSALFEPVTAWIQGCIEKFSWMFSKRLDAISLFPAIKKRFISLPKFLFICFVIIFLVLYYLSLGDVINKTPDISLLFPGTALEQVSTFRAPFDIFHIASFFVNPENYLQTIIYGLITSLFLKIGCFLEDSDGKDPVEIIKNSFVNVPCVLLITLFSSIVFAKLPPDLLAFSLPKVTLDFIPAAIAPGTSDVLVALTDLQNYFGILSKKLLSTIPTIVAIYFLCHSITGFAVAYLGGFFAIGILALAATLFPELQGVLSNPASPWSAFFILLFILALGEFVALLLSEFTTIIGVHFWKQIYQKYEKNLSPYNLVSLLISYFFYPAFGVAVFGFLSLIINEFDAEIFGFSLVSLLVFLFVTFVGYKITKWISSDGNTPSGRSYAFAMIFNIPIWIIYFLLFAI